MSAHCDAINDVPAFTPGEAVMFVDGSSKDLVDRPATFIAAAGTHMDGTWRVRIRLESGETRDVYARRIYRRPVAGGALAAGHESSRMANDTAAVTPPVIPHSGRNGTGSDTVRAAT